MEIKNYFAQDAQGNIMPSANCYLYLPGTTTLATGLVDGNGIPISNPFHASGMGQITFGAPNGVYDLRVALGARDWTIKVQCADIVQAMDVMDSILGSHAENPTTRNNGQPLEPGDETWNSTDKQPYWWSGTAWVALNSSAQQLEERLADPSGAGNGAVMLGRGFVAVATLADLRAIPAAARRSDLRYTNMEYSTGTGVDGHGQWRWDSSNLSAHVTSDPLRGLYAAPSDAPTGASGAFRRVFAGDMNAAWFGVVYGQTVDALAGLTAGVALTIPGRGLVASGDVLLSATWNLQGLAAANMTSISMLGTIYTAATDFIAIKISGQRYKFLALASTKLGAVRIGQFMEIRSSFGSEIRLGTIDKFSEGVTAVGQRNHFGINGIGWLNFKADTINVAGTCFYATTAAYGWVNENKIDIASMFGARGIYFQKAVGQTSRFDGNKIIKPGYEQISGVCQALEFATRTTTEDWRMEGATGTVAFGEDTECSRNVYRGSWAVLDTKLQLNGILSRLEAQIVDVNGATRSVCAQQGEDGVWAYETPSAWASTAYANSVDLRVQTPGNTYPMRLNVKDPNGGYGYLEVQKQNTYQVVTPGAATASVLPGTTIVSVSLGTAGLPLTLTMDVSLENNGREILLNVSSYNATSPLTIKKSSGAITAGTGVTASGLYSLAYFSDMWRISKIGEAYSA